MNPELREAYDERDNELKEGEVITDKEFTNDISETANVQCIRAGMGLGKTFALRKFIKNLPKDKRIYYSSSLCRQFFSSTMDDKRKII